MSDIKTMVENSPAPRVTEGMVDASILATDYVVLPNSQTTICQITMKNGFTVIGQSACASPENFNSEIGNHFAFEDAKKKIWELLAFELKTKLTMIAEASSAQTLKLANIYVGTKVIHAVPMNRRSYVSYRGWTLPVDENGDDEGYIVEYANDGYISWSPKDVFEKSYSQGGSVKEETFLDRLNKEKKELDIKLNKLFDFMETEGYKSLAPVHKAHLVGQEKAMRDYTNVLWSRIQLLNK